MAFYSYFFLLFGWQRGLIACFISNAVIPLFVCIKTGVLGVPQIEGRCILVDFHFRSPYDMTEERDSWREENVPSCATSGSDLFKNMDH